MWRFAQIHKSGRKVKRPRKIAATDKREQFIRQAEKAVKISFVDGITRFKKRISQDKLADMYHARDYTGIDRHIGWDELEGHLEGTKKELAAVFDKSFDHAITTLSRDDVNPDYVPDIRTDAVQGRLEERQTAYLEDLKDVRQDIHRQVAEGHKLGRTPRAVALSIKSQVGLRQTQRDALVRFQKNLETKTKLGPAAIAKRVAAKERRMINDRANMIAITETRVAAAAAETVVWQKQAQDGLLPPATLRVWSAEPDACAKICAPMHGKTAPIDGTWTLPGGREVAYVSESHPNCRCVQYLQDDE